MRKKKKFTSSQLNKFSFRKWTRKSYAVFNSLKIVIKISTLIVGYNLVTEPIKAQTTVDTLSNEKSYDLDEVVIESSRVPLVYSEIARIVNVITADEIAHLPAKGVSDLLNFNNSIDIRKRGVSDVQSDVSVRGGSFEQTLILLNGIMVNDPQTGHHNLDLPISLSDIERVEVLKGPASRVFGPNAYSGAINIITKNVENNFASINSSIGSFNTLDIDLSAGYIKNNYAQYVSISSKTSDGYTNNTDYNIQNWFIKSEYKKPGNKLTFQTGNTNKKFGANSFYTAAFPDQYEKTKTFFTSLLFETGKTLKYTQSIYYRRHTDRFQLKRFDPDFYTNNHLTNIYGVNGNASYAHILGKTSLGWDYRIENILSNVLGISMNDSIKVPNEDGFYFYKKGSRRYLDIYAEHFVQTGNLSFSAGILGNLSNVYGANFSPGIDFSYRISRKIKYYITMNRALRLPTYTELYYVGKNQIGNSELKPERATTLETGLKFTDKFYKGNITTFYREGDNTIDWVRLPDTLLWKTENLTNINTFGVEAEISFDFNKLVHQAFLIKEISLTYSYIDQWKNSNKYLSKYVMDYLKHKFIFSINHTLYKNLAITWEIQAQDRAGTYTNFENGNEDTYNPFLLINANLRWQEEKFMIYADLNNLTNKYYFDFGNIEMPGINLMIGIRYQLKR